jgi:hypothetical protein
MARRPVSFSTRPVSLLLVAAFVGVGLWLFQPWASSANQGAGTDAPLPASLRVDGPVSITSDGDIVRHLVVPLALRGDQGVSLDGAILRAETEMSPTAAAAVPAGYQVRWLDGNDDSTIDAGEHVELLVDLPDHTSVHPGNPLTLVFKTADGGSLTIADVLG